MDFAKFEQTFQELDNGARYNSPALAHEFENAGETRAYRTYAEERIASQTPEQAQAVVERDIKRFPSRYQ